jgi:hypothetical protein
VSNGPGGQSGANKISAAVEEPIPRKLQHAELIDPSGKDLKRFVTIEIPERVG